MDLGVKSMPSTNSSASCSWKSGDVVGFQFPAGLKVLVVDDDPTCLRILEKMLKHCLYEVTTCNRAEGALDFLRDKKDGCDIVISDVHMPDMDGFKLLELVGLEMDLPVIMMSADDSKHVVMKGVTHGACDYLIKPVRIEALKNIWQHVVRKKKQEWKEKDLENSGSVEEGERQQKPLEDVDCSSSFNEGNWKNSKKRKDEEDETEDRDDTSTLKKPRVVWSVDLHQQFVSAVNQLGIDKAVPKRILELMNVPGLTRENVASHLQKFRLYLRRLSGVSQHQNGLGNPFMGPSDAPFGPMSSLDLQALAASGQLPPQSFASIQAAALGRATSRSPVEQSDVFNFESPKLRFVEGQQQLIDSSKQVHLLHGIPTNMDSKQLATLHQSVLGNMNMHLHSQTNQSNPLLMQMGRPQSRSQILNETNASSSPSFVGQPQAIPSAVLVRNGIDHIRGPQYVSISQPSTSADLSSLSTEFSGNISRGFPHNYNVNQNRNQDWGLQDVGSTFMPPQHSNIQGGLDASIQQQNGVVSSGNEPSFSGLGNVGQQLSFSASDSRPLSNNMGGRYGQEDLMSILLKQVDFAPSEHDKLNHYS